MRLSLPFVRNRVAEGVTIDVDRAACSIDVSCPAGFVSASTGWHFFDYYFDPGDGSAPTYQEMLAGVLEDFGAIETCSTPGCETCRDIVAERAEVAR